MVEEGAVWGMVVGRASEGETAAAVERQKIIEKDSSRRCSIRLENFQPRVVIIIIRKMFYGCVCAIDNTHTHTHRDSPNPFVVNFSVGWLAGLADVDDDDDGLPWYVDDGLALVRNAAATAAGLVCWCAVRRMRTPRW